jgi:L-aspartate oxidase
MGVYCAIAKEKSLCISYDDRLSLAPRDIVARAIDNEMKILGDEHVFLDCRQMNLENFKTHFPNIYKKCESIGIDVSQQMIPVAPAAHYSCGGIQVDAFGRTSIQRLYSCGEAASTGLHGANRLASNSLLEAMVFGKRSFEDTIAHISQYSLQSDIPDWNASGTSEPKEMILITQSIKEIQLAMSDYVGIVRSNVRLERAMKRLDLLHEETEQLYKTTTLSPQLCELRNLITVGYLIVKSAQFRKESRGLHYNIDYPTKSAIKQNIVW